MIIIDGTTQPTDFTRTGGRLWIPSSAHIAGEGDATFSDALVCCPLGKYLFVKPQGAYSASQFIALRDVTEGYGTYAQVTGYIFWVGDSSSCGGTVIAHNTADPTQRFLRDPAVATEFHVASITRGGFFLLGNRQGAGAAAGEIKKIVYDGQLDFLVLAVHQLPGEDPELPIVALRHLIASIRWDYGFRLPILLMMGDDSPNHHLLKESDRDSFNSNEWNAAGSPPASSGFPGTPLLLGDITDQADIAVDGSDASQNAAEVAVLDRTGDLGLNWWPVMAFVPNSDGGKAVETTLMGMGGAEQSHKAFYHPLLIPTANSGCPFNTNRVLSAGELERAETLFESTLLLSHSPGADVTNRTTSMWFWDFASVKNITRVRSWTSPSGRLDSTEDNLSFVSDTSVAWESTPRWVTHPLIGREFAIEFYLAQRSANTTVRWFGRHFPQDKFGNLPLLLGAGDVEEGWITSITPFLLSPTASQYPAYVAKLIPLIPPWVKFSWVIPDNLTVDTAADLADFINEATAYLSVRVAGGQARDMDIGDCEGGDDTAKHWTFGINQPSVVLYGKVCDGLSEALGESASLDLRVAPFAVHPQVRNLRMGRTMPSGKKTSIVWPSRLFYISPIGLPIEWDMFKPNSAYSVPLGFWSSQGFQFGNAMGTPLLIDAMQRENAYTTAGILPTTVDIVMEAPTDKGDFPPMMDTTQYDDPNIPGRRLANHFARVDIAPNRVSRATEGGRGGGGGVVPPACANLDALAWQWPLRDNKKLVISADGGFTATRSYGMHCGIDLVYEDGSQQGADILAAADGTIISNRNCPQCGNYIEIAHLVPPFPSTTHVISRYLHMDNPSDRQVGDEVRRGDVIGKVGSLGIGSTGAHLHFAVYCNTVGECESTGIDPCALPWGTPANGICSFDDTGVCTDGCGDTNVENLIVWMFDAAIDAAGDSQYISTPIGQKLRTDVAKAIARAESGLRCNPPDNENSPRNCDAAGPNCTNFESPPNCVNNDRGLFQINLCAHSNHLKSLGIINSTQDLYNCRINIQAAIIISRNGADWSAWSTWTAGTYLRYLN